MNYLALLAALAGSALAIPEAYEARLLRGACSPYGNTFQSGTGWGMLPDLRISASHTGADIDGFSHTTRTNVQRGLPSYEYVRSLPSPPNPVVSRHLFCPGVPSSTRSSCGWGCDGSP